MLLLTVSQVITMLHTIRRKYPYLAWLLLQMIQLFTDSELQISAHKYTHRILGLHSSTASDLLSTIIDMEGLLATDKDGDALLLLLRKCINMLCNMLVSRKGDGYLGIIDEQIKLVFGAQLNGLPKQRSMAESTIPDPYLFALLVHLADEQGYRLIKK